ncbi:hypothetical protein M947_05510 [Sulfurimonas hongkongensis]|uniref:HTH cro/C1-type domain-containing protein n=2 Tax=Sulfurimonas hongkongensis TaxID=1172190 RepID=T0JEL8_9BACT|nr:hypothetical protein M947_05510 [Sulfurimonas hongkongensis]
MTQAKLANLSGISRVTLGNIERDKLGSVSVKTLDIILASLGYELDINLTTRYGLPSL